jgi:membrane protein CcdC involved in cytochrome C biogenesis
MKPFTKITVILLALFGLVHVIRLITGWPVTVNGVAAPLWVSAVALLVAWALAALVSREHRG